MIQRYPLARRMFARLPLTACAVVALVATYSTSSIARAQTQSVTGSSGAPFETRASLTALAEAAERSGRTEAARNIRARLLTGDFRDGVRIAIEVKNSPAMGADTLTVLPGPRLSFRPKVPDLQIPDLELKGVLRSEVAPRITQHIAKYLRDPVVTVTPLVRLSVVGAVGQPSYLDISPALLISDAITLAGGYTATADPERITVRRGSETLWRQAEVRLAISEGYTIDRFSLRDGDELLVGERRQWSWMNTIQIALAATSLVVLLMTQTR